MFAGPSIWEILVIAAAGVALFVLLTRGRQR